MLRLPTVNIAVLKDKVLFSYILPAPQAKVCLQFVHHSWPETINIQMHSNTPGTPIESTFRPNMITIIKYNFLMFKSCELWKQLRVSINQYCMFLFYGYAAVFGWTIILSGFWLTQGIFDLDSFAGNSGSRPRRCVKSKMQADAHCVQV